MPGLNCGAFGLDFMDYAGDQTLEVEDNMIKENLSPKGNP